MAWVLFSATLRVGAQGAGGSGMDWDDPINSLLTSITDTIAPAIGIAGLICAGAAFLMGETGRVFKIALGVVMGGVVMAHARDIWSTFFGGGG
jgi:type IV secretory pathway VirB2 component (pilin)